MRLNLFLINSAIASSYENHTINKELALFTLINMWETLSKQLENRQDKNGLRELAFTNKLSKTHLLELELCYEYVTKSVRAGQWNAFQFTK